MPSAQSPQKINEAPSPSPNQRVFVSSSSYDTEEEAAIIAAMIKADCEEQENVSSFMEHEDIGELPINTHTKLINKHQPSVIIEEPSINENTCSVISPYKESVEQPRDRVVSKTTQPAISHMHSESVASDT